MEPELQDLLARATAPEADSRPMPRALLVFAHPDDETIAVGARIGRFHAAHLVHITDGAPANGVDFKAHGFSSLPEYRQARAEELSCMLTTAGIPYVSRECLDVPDQESSYLLTGITRRVLQIVREHRPEVVFTHPYEGGHPDHDACAFAVHHAVALLKSHGEPAPAIIEAPFYYAGPEGARTGSFSPAAESHCQTVYRLTPEEQKRKRLLLACFASQQETLCSFGVTEERFRIAPSYEFRLPPQPGPALYDNHGWGVSSQCFSELAWKAEDALKEEMGAACS